MRRGILSAACFLPILFFGASVSGNSGRIDRAAEGWLKGRGIRPSPPCSDGVFLRRVHLDLAGTLPTAEEAVAFLDDPDSKKRERVVDELLLSPEHAAYWTMKWCDRLRVKSEFPSKLWPNAVQAYARWIRVALRDNLPYDRFAAALLTTSGSNFRDPPVNFYRALPSRTPEGIAQAVALTFLGERTEGWSEERRNGLAAFFAGVSYKSTSEWKEEIVYFDPAKLPLLDEAGNPVRPVFPDGRPADVPSGTDARRAFVAWLTNDVSFARCEANRVWYELTGRGLVHPPDDFRSENPPLSPELLDVLTEEFRRSGFDERALIRSIVLSSTYGRSSVPVPGNAHDESGLSRYLPRRLEAETLIDAINAVTGSEESYSSAIPEPFTWIPERCRAVELYDGSITSPFLELFGRPPRDSGYADERNNDFSPTQALHLLNSSHLRKKLISNKKLLGWKGERGGSKWKKNREFVEDVYLTILSRRPTAAERGIVLEYLTERKGTRVDVAWALINGKEFLFRH